MKEIIFKRRIVFDSVAKRSDLENKFFSRDNNRKYILKIYFIKALLLEFNYQFF